MPQQWKMLQAGGSLMMSKRAAFISVIQARGAFARPWMRLDRLLHVAGASQFDMRERLNVPIKFFHPLCGMCFRDYRS